MAPKPAAPAFTSFDAWTQAANGFDGQALARESLATWACACSAWTDYLGRVAVSTGPLALYDAGVRLMTDSLEIYSRAAAAPLKAAGLPAPLLNDA